MPINDFDSRWIIPQYSDIETRNEVNISTNLGNIHLSLPIISANMRTVTGGAMAAEMYKNGGLGIIHRFDSIEENINECKILQKITNRFGVSVGVKEDEYERAERLIKEAWANIICIDVAHGHHIKVKKMIEFINNLKVDRPYYIKPTIIAGNVATPEAANALFSWGANIIKCGIGPGFVCTTRKNTGVGVPQLQVIESIKKQYPLIPLIADGGIKTVGDIAKIIAVGADAVMIGAILAGTTETPGNVYPNDSEDLVNRTFYKVYGGSASAQNKRQNRFVEGRIQTIPFKGRAKYILKEIKEGLQSSFSYVGARNIKEFRDKVRFTES